MKISFFGAAREVTGSCGLVEIGQHNILVDCGVFQGGEFVETRNIEPFGFNAREVDAVLITHSHLDHVGRLPLLVARGFMGAIYATPPTADLTRLILMDALSVMEYNHKKYGTPVFYSEVEVNEVMSRFRAVEYGEEITIDLGEETARVKFYDAGHIFGAAFIEISALGKKIVFSGDIGNDNVPIIKDTENLPADADVVVCESTYGDRLHDKPVDRAGLLAEVIARSVRRGGTLMIPAFSLERTQELLYVLNELADRQKRLPSRLPIFLDSPLSINATAVFKKYPRYYDAEATKYFKSGDDPFEFAGLTLTPTTRDSQKINDLKGNKVVIAGAGMMNGGRILHHALRYLSDERSTLFFVGFQAPSTLGRRILEGESNAEIFGQRVPVKCAIETTKALSAHGDQEKLTRWLKSGGKWPEKIILNHGEEKSVFGLRDHLGVLGAPDVVVAEQGKEINISP